jgi:integrase
VKPLIRKTWPKIRRVTIKGQRFYRVDARKTGTNGRQETFKLQAAAEKRAKEIEGHLSANGIEGVSFSAELRGMALTGSKLLGPHGKTILQAAEFYATHLDDLKKKQDSALVTKLASAWSEDKKSGRHKKLRADTLRGIAEASEILKAQFGERRILDISTSDIREFLDQCSGLRRRFNLWSLMSQFFNWCIAHGHTKENPAKPIKIHVGSKDVAIFTPAEALKIMQTCQDKFPDLLFYHAISLFAGLRPNECRLLKWEQIHLDEKTITVLAETSKTKETRNVPIEPTLTAWLETYRPDHPAGTIIPHKNLIKRCQSLHSGLGYRGDGNNPQTPSWPQDVMRHSYGSYWLAKYKHRAVLAENMGNTVEMIKKHYKRVVSKADCAEYWRIVPGYDGRGENATMPTKEQIDSVRSERIRRALEAA